MSTSFGKYTNVKFDCFLKKSLPLKDYHEVKIYEPCVIKSKDQKRLFRYVFLTHDAIHVTENPPKNILYCIELNRITNIEMVNDSAKFLQRDLRDSVQHIVITYVTKKVTSSKQTERSLVPQDLHTITKTLRSNNAAKEESERNKVASTSKPVQLFCLYSDINDTGQFPIVVDAHQKSSTTTLSDSFPEYSQSEYTSRSSDANNNEDQLETNSSTDINMNVAEITSISNALHNDIEPHMLYKLHLYILNKQSTMFAYLNSTWKDYILIPHHFVSEYLFITKHRKNSSINFGISNRYFELEKQLYSSKAEATSKLLFSQLKRELLQCQSTEKLYSLFNEVQVAIERSIFLKKQFWKDDNIFIFSLNLLECCHQKRNISSDEMTDFIELATIICNVLSVSLRVTEDVPGCLTVLSKLSESHLPQLIHLLVDCVATFEKYKNIDAEVVTDFTASSGIVLYQLIEMANRCVWMTKPDDKSITLSLIFHLLGQHNMGVFLKKVLSCCVDICNRGSKAANKTCIEASDAVILFQLFTTVHHILLRNVHALSFAKTHFQEELRYYISVPYVMSQLTVKYPVNNMLLSALQTIVTLVQQPITN